MTNEKINTKLFMGFLLTAELKLLLNQSLLWKEGSILQQQERLIEVDYQQKRYVGHYLSQEKPFVLDLKQKDFQLRETLKSYCPHYKTESAKIFIFPQVLIS